MNLSRSRLFGLLAWLGIPLCFAIFQQVLFAFNSYAPSFSSAYVFVVIGVGILIQSLSKKPSDIVVYIVYCLIMLFLMMVIQGFVACLNGDCL